MSKHTIASTIRDRFTSQIVTPRSLPTQYDNHNKVKDTDLWCRLNIIFGKSEQASIGSPENNRYRTVGVMIAQLFLPVGKGDKALYVMAGHIEDAFKSVTDTGVTFRTPSVVPIGTRDGIFWQVNVDCPFYADEIG